MTLENSSKPVHKKRRLLNLITSILKGQIIYRDINTIAVKTASANLRIQNHKAYPAFKPFAIVFYTFCGVSMGDIARTFKIR